MWPQRHKDTEKKHVAPDAAPPSGGEACLCVSPWLVQINTSASLRNAVLSYHGHRRRRGSTGSLRALIPSVSKVRSQRLLSLSAVSVSVEVFATSLDRTRMPPLVVSTSTCVPPPFRRPSK